MTSTSAQKTSLHGPLFTIDSKYRITHWPRETAEAMKIPASEAVGRYCWQAVYPGSTEIPETCRTFCPAHHVQGDQADTSPPDTAGRRCAALPLPGTGVGSLVWAAVNEPLPPNPLEDLLIRGCLSAQPARLNDTLDLVRQYCAADDVEVFLRDPSHPEEVVLTGCVGCDREAFQALTRIPVGEGYPGAVTQLQRPMFTNDFQNDRIFLRSQVRERGVQAFLGIPLSDGGKDSLGYLGIGWHDATIPITALVPRLEEVLPLFFDRILKEYYRRPELQHAGGAQLRIHCFGGLEVSRDGERLPATAFKRRKALMLLKTLLLYAPRPIHRDLLVSMLWPDADDGLGARNRLHGVVHALRSAIGECYIRNEGDFYAFDTASSHFVDVFRFRDLLGQAVEAKRLGKETRIRVEYLEAAVSLYQGPLFTDDPDGDWFGQYQTRYERHYVTAVTELCDAYLAAGRSGEALKLVRTAQELVLQAERLDELLARMQSI
jgi:DNA-binding SARP family transcriptional activator